MSEVGQLSALATARYERRQCPTGSEWRKRSAPGAYSYANEVRQVPTATQAKRASGLRCVVSVLKVG